LYWQRFKVAGTHFNEPFDVSANRETGECWISDQNIQGSRIVKLSLDGELKVSTGGSEGLRRPTSISVDPTDGSCWVADSEENYMVVRFSNEGYQIGLTPDGLLQIPVAVSVFPLLEY